MPRRSRIAADEAVVAGTRRPPVLGRTRARDPSSDAVRSSVGRRPDGGRPRSCRLAAPAGVRWRVERTCVGVFAGQPDARHRRAGDQPRAARGIRPRFGRRDRRAPTPRASESVRGHRTPTISVRTPPRGSPVGTSRPRQTVRCADARSTAIPTPLVGIGLRATLEGPMDDLYRDYILEHYRRPHNFGVVEDADAVYEGANPLCGDRITLMLGVKDGVVDRVGFTGRGCAISQASASLLTDEIKGKPLDGGRGVPRRRPARPAGHRDQPGPPQVRDAQPRQPPARARAISARAIRPDQRPGRCAGMTRIERRCRCRQPA